MIARQSNHGNRERLSRFPHSRLVRIIALEQHNAAGFAVAKERGRVVGGFLQIAEADDIAVGLDGVKIRFVRENA